MNIKRSMAILLGVFACTLAVPTVAFAAEFEALALMPEMMTDPLVLLIMMICVLTVTFIIVAGVTARRYSQQKKLLAWNFQCPEVAFSSGDNGKVYDFRTFETPKEFLCYGYPSTEFEENLVQSAPSIAPFAASSVAPSAASSVSAFYAPTTLAPTTLAPVFLAESVRQAQLVYAVQNTCVTVAPYDHATIETTLAMIEDVLERLQYGMPVIYASSVEQTPCDVEQISLAATSEASWQSAATPQAATPQSPAQSIVTHVSQVDATHMPEVLTSPQDTSECVDAIPKDLVKTSRMYSGDHFRNDVLFKQEDEPLLRAVPTMKHSRSYVEQLLQQKQAANQLYATVGQADRVSSAKSARKIS